MFTRLFVHYPRHDTADPMLAKLTVASYIETTKNIPTYWLSVAMYEITQSDARWRPSPGEVGTLAIRRYRKHHRWKLGLPEFGVNNPGHKIDLPMWTERAREATGMPTLKAPEPEGLPAEIEKAVENMGLQLAVK